MELSTDVLHGFKSLKEVAAWTNMPEDASKAFFPSRLVQQAMNILEFSA